MSTYEDLVAKVIEDLLVRLKEHQEYDPIALESFKGLVQSGKLSDANAVLGVLKGKTQGSHETA